MHKLIFMTIFALLTTSAPARADGLQLVINIDGEGGKDIVQYDCPALEDPFTVEYLNARPNFLALIELDTEKLIFANVVSASGVHYASGQYVWITKGVDALLVDASAAADASPILTCIETIDTP